MAPKRPISTSVSCKGAKRVLMASAITALSHLKQSVHVFWQMELTSSFLRPPPPPFASASPPLSTDEDEGQD